MQIVYAVGLQNSGRAGGRDERRAAIDGLDADGVECDFLTQIQSDLRDDQGERMDEGCESSASA
jgi:hypothetical protein